MPRAPWLGAPCSAAKPPTATLGTEGTHMPARGTRGPTQEQQQRHGSPWQQEDREVSNHESVGEDTRRSKGGTSEEALQRSRPSRAGEDIAQGSSLGHETSQAGGLIPLPLGVRGNESSQGKGGLIPSSIQGSLVSNESPQESSTAQLCKGAGAGKTCKPACKDGASMAALQ